jgi:crotonobetainyl-CoA:carnitine CoA-transferase CaiB-like acyl-CoA transferase
MVRTIVPDKLTAVTAAQAITAALLARERTGEGQHVRLAMLDAMVSFLWPEAMARYTFVGREGNEPRRNATRDLVFETADGYMTAGTVSDAEWAGISRATEHPEWLEDPRFATATGRVRYWDERLDLVAEALKTRSTEEWVNRFDAEGVPSAPILSRRDLLTDEQISANELIVETEHPHAGRVRQTRPAARFEGTPATLRLPAPTLGEHTEEVLLEVGLDDAEIAELRSAGAVG